MIVNSSEGGAREYLESIAVVVLTSNDAGARVVIGRLETEVTEDVRNWVRAVRNELRHFCSSL